MQNRGLLNSRVRGLTRVIGERRKGRKYRDVTVGWDVESWGVNKTLDAEQKREQGKTPIYTGFKVYLTNLQGNPTNARDDGRNDNRADRQTTNKKYHSRKWLYASDVERL
jgi:hypothetical protein